MFYNDEKNGDQPEYISEKPCDLENPHGVYRLYFKDKGLIPLTNLQEFVFEKDQDRGPV